MRVNRSTVRNHLIALLASAAFVLSSFAQQSPSPSSQQPNPQQATPQKTVADYAREARGEKAAPAPQADDSQSGKSLSELAAERRANRKLEVKLTDKEAGELLTELDTITQFVSDDTGYLKQNPIKHQVVGQEQVKQFWAKALSGSAEADRLIRSEVVLKKFGFVPPDFTLQKYLAEDPSASLGGFYDFRSKTMNLVNWVSLSQQRPIMAHELTHALQDQNFNLGQWQQRHATRAAALQMRSAGEPAADAEARRAVVEGQAMVVYFDYMLKPYGRTLADTDDAMQFIKDRLTSSYDNSLVVRNAPLLFKDSAFFPYREGLMFEMELLKAGGVRKAFWDTFEHPPADTHQVLEPKAYMAGERLAPVVIPDLSGILGANWEAYDTGSIGQLDVRVMAQEFGTENDMFTITPGWKGGSYVAVRRRGATGTMSTADLALLYISRWKDAESAERFAQVYLKSLRKRVTIGDDRQLEHEACLAAKHCPVSAVRVDTNEGPVMVERWPNHTVMICHSFDDATVARLRQMVIGRSAAASAAAAAPDLSLRLQTLPGFHAFQLRLEREVLLNLPASLSSLH